MPRRRALPRRGSAPVVAAVLTCAACLSALWGVGAAPAATRSPLRSSATTANAQFRPRIDGALGLAPAYRGPQPSPGNKIPIVYHGGPVMRDVTVHTVFWAPPGYRFDGPPTPGTLGYADLLQQFLADAAHDSGSTTNVFSLLDQYGDQAGVGGYDIHYDPAVDSIADTDPYPAQSSQCPSPSGVATCVTDDQLQQELDGLIARDDPSDRGLGNLWIILLPPDVDECITLDSCATNAFAGYHSLFDLGHGPTVYAAIPDPVVEFTPPPGSDPEGNPEAEEAIDTVAHETIEAITDPEGTAWMDPNGLETADKCENGPQQGTPTGYAPDGSPYNQLINGHPYLIQYVWANSRGGCVASSTTSASTPDLNAVDLRQFSPSVSGRLGRPGRFAISVQLSRAGELVASAKGESRPNGSWGPLTLRARNGSLHAVGDDRDEITVVYGSSSDSPPPDLVLTGDGGDPFDEAGFTGWFDLDHGNAVLSTAHGTAVIVGPCGQTGVLAVDAAGAPAQSATLLCQNAADGAVVNLPAIGSGPAVTLASEDNRGESILHPAGALVKLTVTLGEPDSVGSLSDPSLAYPPTGFPTCTAFLRIRQVGCSDLVPGSHYRLMHRGRLLGRARAGSSGRVQFAGLRIAGGDILDLLNAPGRTLTALHVAHLRAALIGNQTLLAGGTCQPGEYWGRPVTSSPVSSAVGVGISGSGTVCPPDGRARGLRAADIAQTDEFSGGQTETQVPLVESTAPIQDETLYGPFIASAQSGLPAAHGAVSAAGVPIALTIRRAGSARAVLRAANVDTASGVPVAALAPGAYTATWVLHDAAGDTRTVTTRFADEP